MAVKCRVLESGICSITQPYHINGQKGYSYDHWGIDITDFNGSYNTLGWVVAHTDGVVVEYRNNCQGFEQNSYGNYVKLKHSNGMYTLYAHGAYNTVQVKTGQSVKKGQRLFYMGNTGTSYGGHLHFELRNKNDYKIDPEPYLNSAIVKTADKIWQKYEIWRLKNEKGTFFTGWQEVNGKWYYIAPKLEFEKIMKTGWLYDKQYSGWFLLSYSTGEMLTGWQKVSDKWYYLAPTTTNGEIKGRMVTGWLKDKNKWYYLDLKDGYMYTGTHIIDGKTYYFDNSGALIN